MNVDLQEDWTVEVGDSIVCGKIVELHSKQSYVTLADAFNPFAIARLFHANRKTLQDIPTVCVNSFEMAQSITNCIRKEERSLLEHSQKNAIEIVLPASSIMPEILGDGFPYIRLRIFENGIIHEIISHIGRPLALYSHEGNGSYIADCLSIVNDTTKMCTTLQIPNAITVFYDAHRVPIVIDSNGKSEAEIIGLVGKHEVAENTSVSQMLLRSGILRYCPKTSMLIANEKQFSIKKEMAMRIGYIVFGKSCSFQSGILVKNLSPTGDPLEAAAQLYPSLKVLDKAGLQIILVEHLPNVGFCSEIYERLRAVSFDICQFNEILT